MTRAARPRGASDDLFVQVAHVVFVVLLFACASESGVVVLAALALLAVGGVGLAVWMRRRARDQVPAARARLARRRDAA